MCNMFEIETCVNHNIKKIITKGVVMTRLRKSACFEAVSHKSHLGVVYHNIIRNWISWS